METIALVIIALCLAALFVGFTVVFVKIWKAVAYVVALISAYRSGKQFFKKIERFRRDFSK